MMDARYGKRMSTHAGDGTVLPMLRALAAILRATPAAFKAASGALEEHLGRLLVSERTSAEVRGACGDCLAHLPRAVGARFLLSCNVFVFLSSCMKIQTQLVCFYVTFAGFSVMADIGSALIVPVKAAGFSYGCNPDKFQYLQNCVMQG